MGSVNVGEGMPRARHRWTIDGAGFESLAQLGTFTLWNNDSHSNLLCLLLSVSTLS